MSRSKKYKQAQEALSAKSSYSIDEAIELLPKISTSKFAGSVELHMQLESTKAEKIQLKGSLLLPHQEAKSTKKIVVITTPEFKDKAKGADLVGGEELIKKIEQGWNEFDTIIVTPDIMPKVAILGKILGPKGKMPNPKNDTVTTNLETVIANFKKGRLDYKTDDAGGIHQVVGKTDMDKAKLKENIEAFLKSVIKEINKSAQLKIKSIFLVPTMGPSIKINYKFGEQE